MGMGPDFASDGVNEIQDRSMLVKRFMVLDLSRLKAAAI